MIRYIRVNCRGEWTIPQTPEIREVVIAGVTYLVSVFYKDKGNATAIDKVARLIEKDAESSH